MSMEKNYDQTQDVHVANYIAYADTTDNKLYDGTGTDKTQLTEAQVQDAFAKNRLIVKVGDVFCKPVYINGEKVGVIAASAGTVTEYSAVAAD